MNPSISAATFASYCFNENYKLCKNARLNSCPTNPHLRNSLMIDDRYQLKSILLIAFIFSTLMANAQFKKGDNFVSDYFTVRSQHNTNDNGIDITKTKFNSFSLRPFVGFFLNEVLAIGGMLGYSVNYQENRGAFGDIHTSRDRSFSFGIFARRYFIISEKFFFVVHGESSFARGAQTYRSGSSKNTSMNYNFGLDIKPMVYFFSISKMGYRRRIRSTEFHTL
jgi:hypothetical protein